MKWKTKLDPRQQQNKNHGFRLFVTSKQAEKTDIKCDHHHIKTNHLPVTNKKKVK